MLFRVLIDGYAASVVFNDDAPVFANGHFDVGAEARQCFVDAVVDGFVDEVVKALLADVANVHSGAFAHGL